MTLPVHHTDQGWIVAYTGRWVESTLRPFPGESWLTVDEARQRYESELGVFETVEASTSNGTELTAPRWVFGATRREMIRTQFFNQALSIIASITYTGHDGQLFLNQRSDYEYPDAQTRYTRSNATQIVSSYYKTDGTGYFDVRDNTTRQTQSTAFKDADFSSLWFDWPAFGDWDVFANPENGILPRDFPMTPL
ncbi:hypothetical protein [Cellulomonas sp. NPDC089187]|uniref:hypothetical protein n=1 Tax=Cellulomonas sp. NPDC089187 TaxID=3154970 RepID=UPI00341A5B48